MEKINWERWAAVSVCAAAAGAAIWLGGRVIVTCLLPFVLAWGLSLFITPMAERISRRLHCSTKLCAILLLTVTLCLTVLLIGVSVFRPYTFLWACSGFLRTNSLLFLTAGDPKRCVVSIRLRRTWRPK